MVKNKIRNNTVSLFERPVFWVALFVAIAAGMQLFCRYHFFYVEQNRLFFYIWQYVREELLQAGGVAWLLSDFLLQFFIVPCVGAAITAALLTLAGWLTCRMLREVAPGCNLAVLCLVPVCLLLFLHLATNYLLTGTVAFLMAVAALRATFRIREFRIRLAVAAGITVALYCMAGAVFALYASAVIVRELLFGRLIQRWPVLLLAVEVALTALTVKYTAIPDEYRLIVLPDAYRIPRSRSLPPGWLLWLSVPLLLAVARLSLFNAGVSKRKVMSSYGLQLVIVGALCVWGLPRYSEEDLYPQKMFDYCCRTRQWDRIKAACHGTLGSSLKTCYLNLALAEKGELADSAFVFDQTPVNGLLPTKNMAITSYYIAMLYSDIFFTANHIALSQRNAFEAGVGNSMLVAGNGRTLTRLIQTNLILGAYPVAEKYIRLLEHTFGYRTRAAAHRRFLYNDAAVEADPLLGPKRRALPKNSSLSVADGVNSGLLHAAESNPSQKAPLHYLAVFMLCNKNLNAIKSLTDSYYGTPLMPQIPRSISEALLLIDSSPEFQQKYGISKHIADRYIRFRTAVAQSRTSPSKAAKNIAASFGDTYWYYHTFKEAQRK
ncbi:MAG: DUF6057 family protein [Bacteroidales bacterium]|jgi:hypothetical protein|nr:DUF6057 family protein [Bacteroidales bacterium]